VLSPLQLPISLVLFLLPLQLDSLRLDRQADRVAFRRWFTFLAEAQFFVPPQQRSPDVADCSSLVRYAYREALRDHNSAWAAQAHLPLVPAIPSVAKYSYPKTPVGPNLFRVAAGKFSEFADAATLYRYNVFFVSRDLMRSEPGDVLFYRHENRRMPFHTMIVLGQSQVNRDSTMYVVYHTGPDGTDQGEIKRLSFQELLHYPDREWQSISQNRSFLGVFRWNILRD
jgi:uncharacterized protein YfaT (DUF1175 family)